MNTAADPTDGHDFTDVTELSGEDVSKEQIVRLCERYYWALEYCINKDVLEVACGTGQGLGLLQKTSKSLIACDYSEKMVNIAKKYYGSRIDIHQCDALNLPFSNNSFDVILIFEAIYYLRDVTVFFKECRRLLRQGGVLLIVTANCDLFDFNPSPHSVAYYGVLELEKVLRQSGFGADFLGGTPINSLSLRQKILRPVKTIAVRLGLVPSSMAGKKLLKRLVFGGLTTMPAEIDKDTAPFSPPTPISAAMQCLDYKVVYVTAKLIE